MLEESISCSPGNDKKTSRSRRFYKKTKRKSSRLLSETPFLTNCSYEEDIEPSLDFMYEAICSAASNDLGKLHLDHFDPFEDVKILAAAELAEPTSTSSKFSNCLPQGFIRLKELSLPALEDDDEQPTCSRLVHAQVPTDQVGPETQFGITESEFVRFCEEAEIGTESQSSDVNTPKATKSIVDAILQDFCGSPFSESPPKSIDYDATPVFRFKTKSIRTYSRQRKFRRNIGSEMANVCLPDDEGNMSDSSGLSMQEDMSQTVVPQLDTVDLNNSIKVCENLNNLSSYFSQVSSQERTPPISVEKKITQFSDIINDIIGMRRKPYRISRSRSTDEFNGFSDSESDSNDNLKNLLEEEDDVLQTIDCDSLCYETDTPKVSIMHLSNDIENVLRGVDAVINKANKLISPRCGLNNKVENSSGRNQQYCDTHEDIVQSSARNASLEEDKVFDDIELWSDNDCLLNYKTQKPPKSTDSKRRLSPAISRENKQSHRAINDWNSEEVTSPEKNIFEKPIKISDDVAKSENTISECSSENVEQQDVCQYDGRKTSALAFQGLQKASRRAIAIPTEAKQRAVAMLNKFEQEEEKMRNEESNETTSEELKRSSQEINSHKPSVSGFQGFQTASKKPITISAEAKQRAEALLRKFEQEDKMRTEETYDTTLEDLKRSSVETNANKPSVSGFQTASRKPFAISAEAKLRAGAMLKKFEQEEEKMRTEASNETISEELKRSRLEINGNKPSVSGFQGFQTASRKPFAISAEAKLRADAILKKFEQEEEKMRTEASNETISEELKMSRLEINEISGFQGFQTASRKPIAISAEAKLRADAILKKFEQEEEKMRTEASNETISEDLKRSRLEINANKPCVSGFQGFQTASRKPIAISAEAKLRADAMLKKFEEEEEMLNDELKKSSLHINSIKPVSNYQGFQTASMNLVTISAEVKQKADAILTQEMSNNASEYIKEDVQDHNGNSTRDVFKIPCSSNAVGFVTASRKPIAVSNEAKLKADEILRKFDLEEKQTVENVAENDQEWLVNTEFFAEDFEEELEIIQKPVILDGMRKVTQAFEPCPQDSAFEGFKTASKKAIFVSEAAKRYADQLVREINEEDLPQDFRECIEADVIDLATNKSSSSVSFRGQVNESLQMMSKTRYEHMHAREASNSVSISKNNKSDKLLEETNSLVQSIKQDVNQNEVENDQAITSLSVISKSFAERRTGSRSQEYDTTATPHNLKRKHSADLQQTPMGIPKRRLSCTERTPLNRIENAILHSCASVPLIKSTPKSALISRKNLLSLSKRKKINSPSTVTAVTAVNNSPKTPDRAHDSTAPDLKEFFESVSTSTPRLIRTDERNAVGHLSKDSLIDTDFKKINWEDANNSARACRSDANVICSMVSPSPKERIERLKMYGEPPPISPILMTKQCRPSGLRRGRSLMKP